MGRLVTSVPRRGLLSDMHYLAVAAMSIENAENLPDLLGVTASIVVGPVGSPADVADLTGYADALIVALQPLSDRHIAAFGPRVSVIGRAGAGLDTVDLAAARRRRMAVIHEPAAATSHVADHAAALILCLGRQVMSSDRALRGASGWVTNFEVGRVVDLSRCTLGVVGLGRIRRALIERMRPFVARVLVYDPYVSDPKAGVEMVGALVELLAASDIVTLHVPLNEQNRHLIGRRELLAMPQGSFLVNVSRGGLVDESALIDALVSEHLAGAAIDVFTEEPLPLSSPLRRTPRLVLTPHLAGYAEGALEHITQLVVEDVIAHLDGARLPHGSYAVGPFDGSPAAENA